jgi:hypothetical protein
MFIAYYLDENLYLSLNINLPAQRLYPAIPMLYTLFKDAGLFR